MTSFASVSGLVGGGFIGLAAVFLMLTIGRIAGVCGIVLNAMTAPDVAESHGAWHSCWDYPWAR
jgi:hypothetical protein